MCVFIQSMTMACHSIEEALDQYLVKQRSDSDSLSTNDSIWHFLNAAASCVPKQYGMDVERLPSFINIDLERQCIIFREFESLFLFVQGAWSLTTGKESALWTATTAQKVCTGK